MTYTKLLELDRFVELICIVTLFLKVDRDMKEIGIHVHVSACLLMVIESQLAASGSDWQV